MSERTSGASPVIFVLDDVLVGFVVNIYVIIVSSVWVGLIVPIVISTVVVVDTLIIKKACLSFGFYRNIIYKNFQPQ